MTALLWARFVLLAALFTLAVWYLRAEGIDRE
jgi:hypothetical protein